MGAARLGQLVFVVGELQVDPARVYIEDLAQDIAGHGAALDVPARAAAAPRAGPARLIVRRWLPDHKIHRVAFVRRDLDPRTGDHIVD